MKQRKKINLPYIYSPEKLAELLAAPQNRNHPATVTTTTTDGIAEINGITYRFKNSSSLKLSFAALAEIKKFRVTIAERLGLLAKIPKIQKRLKHGRKIDYIQIIDNSQDDYFSTDIVEIDLNRAYFAAAENLNIISKEHKSYLDKKLMTFPKEQQKNIRLILLGALAKINNKTYYEPINKGGGDFISRLYEKHPEAGLTHQSKEQSRYEAHGQTSVNIENLCMLFFTDEEFIEKKATPKKLYTPIFEAQNNCRKCNYKVAKKKTPNPPPSGLSLSLPDIFYICAAESADAIAQAIAAAPKDSVYFAWVDAIFCKANAVKSVCETLDALNFPYKIIKKQGIKSTPEEFTIFCESKEPKPYTRPRPVQRDKIGEIVERATNFTEQERQTFKAAYFGTLKAINKSNFAQSNIKLEIFCKAENLDIIKRFDIYAAKIAAITGDITPATLHKFTVAIIELFRFFCKDAPTFEQEILLKDCIERAIFLADIKEENEAITISRAKEIYKVAKENGINTTVAKFALSLQEGNIFNNEITRHANPLYNPW